MTPEQITPAQVRAWADDATADGFPAYAKALNASANLIERQATEIARLKQAGRDMLNSMSGNKVGGGDGQTFTMTLPSATAWNALNSAIKEDTNG